MLRALSLLFAASACSVDDRALALAAEDGGSAATSAGGSAGTGGEPSDGGVEASHLVDGCADLDTDGVADCEVTLLEGPTFASDVAGWTPVGDAELSWDPRNALDDLPSGSARLSAGSPRASAVQCVALKGAWLVIAYANSFVETAAATEHQARAQLDVTFYDADGCSGPSSGYFETPPSDMTGAWATIHAGGVSNQSTRSVSIALAGNKGPAAAAFDVYFDNLMLKALEL
jgi:hypothetical protein